VDLCHDPHPDAATDIVHRVSVWRLCWRSQRELRARAIVLQAV
jgi:hypothetical protein